MPHDDTILALASPPGWSTRAILRLSGPHVPRLLPDLLPGSPAARGMSPAALILDADRSFPVIVARFEPPASATGEHAADIFLPGSPHLVERARAVFLRHEGVRCALPGEFSARAYLNARLTLDQAEGIAMLIAARTSEELDAAHALASGAAGARFRDWIDRAVTLLALVEAGIDFTDQEGVVPVTRENLRSRAHRLASDIRAALRSSAPDRLDEALPLVALVGPASAGKSALFNALLRRERSVVSPRPGSTRDALVEELTLDTVRVRLADLPGLDAHDPAPAGEASRRAAHDAAASADILVHCDDRPRFSPLPWPDRPTIRVRTKADRPAPAADPDSLPVCALDGHGLPTLRRAIADLARARTGARPASAARHARAMTDALQSLDALDAAIARDPGRSGWLDAPELAASCLREALDRLGELDGRVTPDDVLGRVFASFCVGK